MSYVSWHTYGYGVKVSDVSNISTAKVVDLIQTASNYALGFNKWVQECNIEEPTLEDFQEFDDTFGLGLATILQQVILEKDGLEFVSCSDFEGDTYLLFPQCYPWDMSEREKNLKEQDIQTLLVKYFGKITDETITVDFYEPENGG